MVVWGRRRKNAKSISDPGPRGFGFKVPLDGGFAHGPRSHWQDEWLRPARSRCSRASGGHPHHRSYKLASRTFRKEDTIVKIQGSRSGRTPRHDGGALLRGARNRSVMWPAS
jgi:hypothetical protein